jgi:hypothetical protein
MTVLILNNQPIDNWITSPPIGDYLKMGWLQAPHTTDQVWSGPHERDLRLLQKSHVSALNNQSIEAAESSGMPPCLGRKLTRQNGMACSAF